MLKKIGFSLMVMFTAVSLYWYWRSWSGGEEDWSSGREGGLSRPEDRKLLPKNARARHYTVNITPNFETFRFEGTVDIEVDIMENTYNLILNAKDLEIEDVSVYHTKLEYSYGKHLKPLEIVLDAEEETLRLEFPERLQKGLNISLIIKYTGYHNDKMTGFYRSSYVDNNKTEYMMVTQFEATHARSALPCWDEPDLKATFTVSLTVPMEMTGLSNMPLASAEVVLKNGVTMKKILYEPTPLMSTYLLAMAVGKFDYREAFAYKDSYEKKFRVRVYAPHHLAKHGRFALKCAVRMLEFFERTFDFVYPLPKLDMLAVPDFDAGAMENWGLITYRTVLLLFDEEKSALSVKQNIAYVVGHELAHQWFGNLVTMQWWDELWLNEGFATWAGWLAVDHIYPEWEIWTNFISTETQRGLLLDGMRSSHPIEVPVSSATDIMQIFDAISYSKGATVIRMLVSYLGQDVFLKGVIRYLKRHSYRNASTKDLWNALSEESDHNVEEFMQFWTRRVGYPLLTLKDISPTQYSLTQHRFLSTGDVKPEEDETIWWIPLNVLTTEGLEQPHLVLKEREAIFDKPKEGEFLKLNHLQQSMFRVNYPIEYINTISKEADKLSASDRLGILLDTFSLAESGQGSTVHLLQTLEGLREESHYLVLKEIVNCLERLRSLWSDEPEPVLKQLTELQHWIFAHQAKYTGWTPSEEQEEELYELPMHEFFLENLKQPLVLGAAGNANYLSVIEAAKERFKKMVNGDVTAVHPNVRSTVLTLAVKFGGAEEWEHVYALYQSSEVADEKVTALQVLGATRVPELVKRTLNLALDPEMVKPQDLIYIYQGLGANPTAKELVWQHFKENFDSLYERFKQNLSILNHLVKNVCSVFNSELKRTEIEAFFAAKQVAAIERPLSQSLERVRINAKWLERDREPVNEWLSIHSKKWHD